MANSNSAWRPSTSFRVLQLRAHILADIRQFFAARQILEVETPLLSHATVTDQHLHSFQTDYYFSDATFKTLYLQTSPEFAMKRLLAADSGPIYQICKAFRNRGESGIQHNPEFTLLEWYRPGFNHHDLMDEVADLFKIILPCESIRHFSYAELFQQFLQVDPHDASVRQLKAIAAQNKIQLHSTDCIAMEKDDWLNLLMTHCIEPKLPKHLLFIYDFPASQAALARIRHENPPIAERFEVYMQGMELANGFHELNIAEEQRARFQHDLLQRKKRGHPSVPLDENFLAALEHGLPDCAGVALGLDRLFMIAAKKKSIAEVIPFSLERA
jgi:elongation factor P--(R)-beta-lysine ligase